MPYNQPEFWPNDGENAFYIPGESDMEDILARIEAKWPGAKMADITIEADYIQTHCLGYDLYDSGDYTKFILITRKVTA